MSAGFGAIGWNRKKVVYDLVLLAGVILFIGVAIALDWRNEPPKNAADMFGL